MRTLPPRTTLLAAVLGLREDGLRGLPIRTARLTALLVRPSHWCESGRAG
ncbi:hypothetical protein [Nocardia cyriacigeorgica]|jgi:hypothetical protein|nr:hypothetical protein [Nocardia cyriacigeorgica]MBF6435369.1 hypothetical protein [Nocardia cyriacigeorgica]